LVKLAGACGLPLPELLDFDRLPPALAEAQAKYDRDRVAPSDKRAKGKLKRVKSKKKG